MLPHLFSAPEILIPGVFTGIILGVFFQKGQISQFKTIVGQLLFKNFIVLKIIMTAIVVGSIGIFFADYLGILHVDLFIKPRAIFGAIIGGIIFGIGMATLGYCPGTCVAAAGQGSRDGFYGILGMLFGAWVYAELHTTISKNIPKTLFENTTLPQLFGISPSTTIFGITAFALVLFAILSKLKK